MSAFVLIGCWLLPQSNCSILLAHASMSDLCSVIKSNFQQRSGLQMNFSGILLGLVSFLCIGLFHPLVIKGEYYFGTKCWWVFACVGIAMLIGSLFTSNMYLYVILGVIAFSSFWSILELFQQEKRVQRGWFPKNPKRK